MKKKFGKFALMLSVVLVAGFVSCSSEESESETKTETKTETPEPQEVLIEVAGASFDGTETWKPVSNVFVSGRSITIGNLYVSDHEVTQAEYTKYCKYGASSPSETYGLGDNYPVYYVSWYDAIVYCNLRSIAEALTPVYSLSGETDPRKWTGIQGDAKSKYCGPSISDSSAWKSGIIMNIEANGYRLPTEAEWEYIAREGKTTGTEYSGSDNADNVAWHISNSNGKTHEVKTDKVSGTSSANAFGIYDMSGNVWEWCWDWYSASLSATSAATGSDSGDSNKRVIRGGSRINENYDCALNVRDKYYIQETPYSRDDFTLGFRVVRSKI